MMPNVDGIGCLFLARKPSYQWHSYILAQLEKSGDGDYITDFHTGKISLLTSANAPENYLVIFKFPNRSDTLRVNSLRNVATIVVAFAMGYFAGYGRAEGAD